MPHKDPIARKEYQRQRREKYKDQIKEYQKEYQTKNREKLLEYKKAWWKSDLTRRIKKRYGIEFEEYHKFLVDQNNSCGICKKDFTDDISIYIDHCHKTGKVRGLLCLNCNVALGHFKDDPILLKQAVSYLEQ